MCADPEWLARLAQHDRVVNGEPVEGAVPPPVEPVAVDVPLPDQLEALREELPFMAKRLRYLAEHGKYPWGFVTKRTRDMQAVLATFEAFCRERGAC